MLSKIFKKLFNYYFILPRNNFFLRFIILVLKYLSLSENNDVPSCTSKEIEIVKRCNQCNKIPLIEIIQKEDKYFIKYNWENGHKDEINLEDFLNNNKNSINKIDCFECKKEQENGFFNYFLIIFIFKGLLSKI